ncbi:transcription repressor NadR [Kyrpidia tusciae]|uniref:Helix-turn-helix type 11 domain protein n=1 Tax=Kyrpidia tusciae (strain DSM 2912 / NBRC 15312 / T2) TaxID=562970 RepID=D5WPC4_KYRT2|nr:transcription repressor NadR [Kyrpidia tusciae]ADG06183.1 Helix-turn-helix type 11 domain protein [Kyrpidia tusciae DSM 2912]
MTRRERLLHILYREPGPVPGGELARRLGVSRQTVVSDIARLRGEGMAVLSTPQGYVLGTRPHFYREFLGIVHTPEQLPRELEILVGHGVSVEDVWIDHPVYGRVHGRLDIATPEDLAHFLEIRARSPAPLFSEVTGGLHYHTLLASGPEPIARARKALVEAGFYLLQSTPQSTLC